MGSFLQAYGLMKVLQELGHEVEFIDIQKNPEDYQLLGDNRQTFEDEREKSAYKARILKIDKYILRRLKYRNKVALQDKIFEQFRNMYFKKNTQNKYDVCVIGSDEVFNCMNSGQIGFTSQLFGNVPQAKRVITYAACCGSTKFELLSGEMVERITQSFSNVAHFSVRDQNTFDFVRKCTEKNVCFNLDPVLVSNFDTEMKEAQEIKIPGHYCIIYSYYNRFYKKEEIEEIKLFCKKKGLIPVSVGAPQFWADDHIVCSPFECLTLFRNADFVITDTFHGCIFATKYSNHFAVIIRDSNRNKLEDLVQRLNIQSHVVFDMKELEQIFNTKKDSIYLNDFIKKELERTKCYLESSILS